MKMDTPPSKDGFFSRQMKRTVGSGKGGSGSALPGAGNVATGSKPAKTVAMNRTPGKGKGGSGASSLPPNKGSGMTPRGGAKTKTSHGHVKTER